MRHDSGTGAGLFVRYAYPPNRLGYCGPEDVEALVAYGVSGVSDPGLRQLVTAFEGAYPYLELIAAAAGLRDPLDRRVVEAYWIGNRLLTGVDMARFGRSMTERFRNRAKFGAGTTVEQDDVLAHQADLAPQILEPVFTDVHAVQTHLAGIDIIEPRQQAHQGRLAAARPTDDRKVVPRRDREADVV